MTSCDYSTHILLLDMKKAFDSIKREHLHRLLSDILDPDELNIMNIVLKDVTLQVKQMDNLLQQLKEFHKKNVSEQFFYIVHFKYFISKNINSST